MKKLILAVIAALFAFSASMSAQGFGVIGGLNFNSAKIKGINVDTNTGWNLGVTYAFDLPLGFSLQPSLVYTQNGVDLNDSGVAVKQTVGAINLPVSLQWGPDLLVVRPFVDVTPYIGYSLYNKAKLNVADIVSGKFDTKNVFDYGLGVGAGLNVWKLQFILRYNWNFGTMDSLKNFTEIELDDLKLDNNTFGGLSLHLAYFF